MSSLLSSFKGTAQSLTAIHRPWRDFFDITAVDIPTSSDATTRIAQNLTHFRLNYTIILLVILCLSLIYHPLALVTFFVIFLAWFFLYLARDRDEPVVIFGFLIDDRLVLAALVGLTVAGLVLTGVWGNVLVSVLVGVGFTILHAVLRSTDDLVMDDLESPYGHVLAGGDDELDSPRGDYTVFVDKRQLTCGEYSLHLLPQSMSENDLRSQFKSLWLVRKGAIKLAKS